MSKKNRNKSTSPAASSQSSAARARARSAELRSKQAASQRRRELIVQLSVIAVVAVVVVAVVIAVLHAQKPTPAAKGIPPNMTKNSGVLLGAKSAKVTISVIEDFQCPACKAFEQETGPLLAQYEAGDQVKVEYRGIAFLDQMSSTDYSSRALNASACVAAEVPSKWKAFHDTLYANQPEEQSAGLTDAELTSLAVGVGAPESKVKACIADGKYKAWVKATTDATMGHNGVQGTPTVYVDGTAVDKSPDVIRAAVKDAQAK